MNKFYEKYLKYDLNNYSNPNLDTYKIKYLKYKNKYLKLKAQLGGRNINIYNKTNSQLDYQIDIDPEDDIYTLKSQILSKKNNNTYTVDDIEIYTFKSSRCTIPKLNSIGQDVSDVCVDFKKKPNASAMIPKNIKTGIDPEETIIDGQTGKFFIEDNVIFEGKVFKGKKYFNQLVFLEKAIGQVKLPDGTSYTGLFKNNLLNGPGRILNFDGIIFQGQFENNNLNGQGKVILPNGDTYEGAFVDNKLNGEGKILNDYETLSGEFVNNVLVRGEISNTNGYFAKGSFVDMLLDGEGIKQFGDGEKQEGFFTLNKLNGPGKITLHNGIIIEGTFSDGEYNGKIKKTYSDGIIEEALYVNGKIQGKIKLTDPSGLVSFIEPEY